MKFKQNGGARIFFHPEIQQAVKNPRPTLESALHICGSASTYLNPQIQPTSDCVGLSYVFIEKRSITEQTAQERDIENLLCAQGKSKLKD